MAAPLQTADAADHRERIVELTLKLLRLAKDQFHQIPGEVFVYGYDTATGSIDYRSMEYFGHDAEDDPGAAFFAALRYLFALDRVGGWSFGFVTPPDWVCLQGHRNARGFVGFEQGKLSVQYYGMADPSVKAAVRELLAQTFAAEGVTLAVFD